MFATSWCRAFASSLISAPSDTVGSSDGIAPDLGDVFAGGCLLPGQTFSVGPFFSAPKSLHWGSDRGSDTCGFGPESGNFAETLPHSCIVLCGKFRIN